MTPQPPSTLGVPHHHIKRAVVWYLVLLVAGTVAVWWMYRNNTSAPDWAKDTVVSSYSISGEVVSRSSDKNELVIKTGWLSDGKYTYYERTVSTSADTKFFVVTKDGTAPVVNKNPLDYIQMKDKVTVYGTGNPYGTTTLVAEKIDVQR